MKKIILIFIIFIFSINLFCENLRIGILNGPTSIPSAYLIDKNDESYDFQIFSEPAAVIPKMIKKEIDIAFLPVNVAAKLYKSSKKQIVSCAVTGNGNLAIVTKDKKIKKMSDLKGKTIHVAGKGATPEYMLSFLIDQNGYEINSKKGITLDFSIPTQQLPAMLINNKVSYALLPEPFATMAVLKDKSVFKAIDIQQEYSSLVGLGKQFPQTVMVVRKEFAKNNPALYEQFMQDYEQAYEWTLSHIATAGKLCSKLNLGLDAKIVEESILSSNFVFYRSYELKNEIEDLLKLFLEVNPSSIGDELPDNLFYFNE